VDSGEIGESGIGECQLRNGVSLVRTPRAAAFPDFSTSPLRSPRHRHRRLGKQPDFSHRARRGHRGDSRARKCWLGDRGQRITQGARFPAPRGFPDM